MFVVDMCPHLGVVWEWELMAGVWVLQAAWMVFHFCTEMTVPAVVLLGTQPPLLTGDK